MAWRWPGNSLGPHHSKAEDCPSECEEKLGETVPEAGRQGVLCRPRAWTSPPRGEVARQPLRDVLGCGSGVSLWRRAPLSRGATQRERWGGTSVGKTAPTRGHGPRALPPPLPAAEVSPLASSSGKTPASAHASIENRIGVVCLHEVLPATAHVVCKGPLHGRPPRRRILVRLGGGGPVLVLLHHLE